MQHIYRLPSQRSRGILHSSTIKDSHRQKNLFSCALYKEKAIQLFEHKRKSIPLDDGGDGIFMCSGPPPPNSCMLYLGQSKWPEDRKKKSERPYIQSYKKDLIQALSYHLRKRQGPPCVKDSSLELLCLKAWKTGTDLELEINNLLNNSWYLPDLKSCANEAPWDFIPISSLGDEDRLWMSCVCRQNSQDDMTAELHLAPGTQQGDCWHSLKEK